LEEVITRKPFQTAVDTSKLTGYKVKLYPTDDQKKFLNRQIELFRYVYNWGIETEQKVFELHKNGEAAYNFLVYSELEDLYIDFKKEHEFLNEIPNHTAREALRYVEKVYREFFVGYSKVRPRFKSSKKTYKSFAFRNENNAFYFKNGFVKIPGLCGRGDMILCKNHHGPTDYNQRFYRPAIKFDGYNYWLCYSAEKDLSEFENHEPTEYENESIGIDIGFRKLAQLSIGQVYYHPDVHVLRKRYNRQQSRLAKMRNTRLSKARQARSKLEDIPMSKNEIKLKESFYKTRMRIQNIQKSNYHKITTEIANMYPKRIVMENANLRDMRRKKNKNRISLEQTPLHYMREFLTYKCEQRGIELIFADRWFPSTKTCSCCGTLNKVGRRKIYRCSACGLVIDRDLNAAINLSRYEG